MHIMNIIAQGIHTLFVRGKSMRGHKGSKTQSFIGKHKIRWGSNISGYLANDGCLAAARVAQNQHRAVRTGKNVGDEIGVPVHNTPHTQGEAVDCTLLVAHCRDTVQGPVHTRSVVRAETRPASQA